ncbi:PRC-barrel domain-containing protein [Profundibacterium mesophilum]|uniref:PRC-barrel domain containing protein n=1 Tax=Profundibacterium mesophilum KAUST100406-0324 TaxID=1037889 RepID=A0A921P1A1_9RHOB|nr:PRC-barrel domain-containing protein [Profundibacterium mesophilum]KAF0677348.1 PRC-barrel domain containing protein [Profundibacterium mesophilum KAUST100406-0324]
MKRFLTTAATALVLSTAAYAEQHTAGVFAEPSADQSTQLFASDLLGKRIYASENAVEGYEAGDEGEWDDLGEVNDMVLNQDGSIKYVILGVGGFLGVGERDVAVNMTDLQIVRDGEDATDYFLVVTADRAMIENAPEFSRSEMTVEESMKSDEKVEMEESSTEMNAAATGAAAGTAGALATQGDANTTTETVEVQTENAETELEQAGNEVERETGEAMNSAERELEEAGNAVEQTGNELATETDQAMNSAERELEEAGNAVEQTGNELATETDQAMNSAERELEQTGNTMERELLVAPEIEREGFETVQIEDLTTDDLTGATVYGPDDENVGDIGELILGQDGKSIEKAIIDVGGFLGMGEHSVAVTFDELRILRSQDGGDMRVYINSSEEALESLPEYEK